MNLKGWASTLPATYTEPEVQLTRGQGCLQCRKTTYQGREAVFEVMSVTDAIRDLINRHKPVDEIKKAGLPRRHASFERKRD